MEKLIIIGSGPAGLTAAIYAARANLSPLVLAGALPGGLLIQTSEVENFPGFPDGIGGVDLMMNMQTQAEKFGARIEYDEVTGVELSDGGTQKLSLASGTELECEALIIATGASPRYLGIPSEEKFRNKGVSACATCDGAFFKDMPVVVVGGGDSAVEEALFLTSFASQVTLIHRRDTLRASKIMAERALNNPKIRILWNSEVSEIFGNEHVEGVRVKNPQTGETLSVPCRGYFAALGHIPNTALYREYLDVDEHGYFVRQSWGSKTKLGGVFIAGDSADASYRQAITAAGSGAQAAIDAEKYLAAKQ